MLTFKTTKDIATADLLSLYTPVGWRSYTSEPEKLTQAIKQSYYVLSAWEDERLVGLIRCISDGLTILYVQDLLVLPDYQNQGLGSQLMQQTFETFKDIRQKVLITSDAPDVRHFYEKQAMNSCDQGQAVAFYREY
ncbi:GNAT family N-acetyltransferase [Vagococcus zengguangii]|uniref:GNAT family N-acetyltransferase n=1 Tax=Vagococcus zengguangii TaxID=2571750 RepID=A0A4D7D012_9ENTE|nr:GNAT family N-acetyltransferase [Vagococcus zengguangii]QCI87300.1 GNAT family N-acetyltransferase [Vagococcus zengguangii]TLG79979.1 GNAT family N-acetyltransferase [Vagococcus zengguangii]